ncbi:MAG: helix-turn-helix domain-containing protein [Clostridia bacterium]|nr:helix-turn-helix domain-containing protein [Clostridia bacterium]
MRLSIYMALDALAEFLPIPAIQDGEARLAGFRLGLETPDTLCLRETAAGVELRAGRDRVLVPGQRSQVVANRLSAAMALWDAWERRLFDAAVGGDSLQALVDEAFRFFDEPIFITDTRDRIAAITPHPAGAVNEEWDYMLEHGVMPADRLMKIYRDPLFRRFSAEPPGPFIFSPPGMEHRGINLQFRDADTGSLLLVAVIIEHRAPITIGRLHLAQCFYEAVRLHLRLHPAREAAEIENALLRELLGGGAIAPERAALFAARMFPEAEQFLIAVLRPSGTRPVLHAAPMLERAFPGARCLSDSARLTALLPFAPDAAERLRAIAEETDARAGLSRPFADWARMGEYCAQARTALDAGDGYVNELSAASIAALCARALQSGLAGLALEHPALELLARYDRRHHGALLPTLKSYLIHERNLVRTAEALFIHRNSLVYRIRRIQELTGLTLENPEERLYLLCSFALRGEAAGRPAGG